MGGEPTRQDKPKAERPRAERPAPSTVVQKKLQVGSADDPLEREADQVARIVVGMERASPPGPLGDGRIRQRHAAERTAGADGAVTDVEPSRVRRRPVRGRVTPAAVAVSRVQRAGAIGRDGGVLDPESERLLQSARRGRGKELDAPVQRRIGEVLGADVSGVRLHEGAVARDLNDRMSAQAFTISNDVFFRDGVPDVGSSSGLGLVAHEVTHAVQQGASPVSRRVATDPAASEGSEHEASGEASAPRPRIVRAPHAVRRVLAPDDPRKVMLEGFLQDRQALGPDHDPVRERKLTDFMAGEGARATAEAQQLATMPGKASSGVDREGLSGFLQDRQALGPDHDPVRERKLTDFMAGEGARATAEAQSLVLDGPGALAARDAAGEMTWARGLVGDDRVAATELLSLYHALPEPAFKAFLTQNANDAAKLTFARTHLAVLGPNFEQKRFDLLYSRPGDLVALEQLLTVPPMWTVDEITGVLTGPPALSPPHQSKLLTLCVQRGWTTADASALFGPLSKPCAEALCDDAGLLAGVLALAPTWTLAGVGAVLGAVWAKKADAVVAAQFLTACADIGFTRDGAQTFVAGLAAPKVVVVAQSAAVHAQLKALLPTWTNAGQMAQVVAKLLNKSNDATHLAGFLAFCAGATVSSADADKWITALNKPVLVGLVQTANLRAKVTALLPTWTDAAKSAQLLVAFHGKQADFEVLAKFLGCCALKPWGTDDSRKLVDGLAEPILTGIASTPDLQTQLKAVTATWTDFTKIAQLLTAYHAKEATFTVLAKYLKGCATHAWTQDNARKLVDGLTQPPLKELSETADLLLKVHEIGAAVWTDFTKIAAVVEEAHTDPSRMTAAEKSEFLVLCRQDTYRADRAKRFITVSKQAAGYTWPQRFEQVRKFRGHAQPASGTNNLGGAFHDMGNFPSNGHQIYLGLPENKLTHFKDGHSYEAFWFQVGNCHRYGGLSSMWAPGTDIGVKAAAAATSTAHMVNAAFGGGGTQHQTGNYTIAYTYYNDDLGAAPPEIGVAISQLYPKGGWMHHQLKGHLAEGIGRLKGYIT